MLISGIKSRPQYAPLTFDETGQFHLLIGQGDGGAALMRWLNTAPSSADIRAIYTGESLTGMDCSSQLGTAFASRLIAAPTQIVALQNLDDMLSECVMGTRLYVAGSESFIGSVEQVAAKYNLERDEVQREHAGSRARRVYCIHCRTSLENVTTNIVGCTRCSRQLLVRDHYSRRLAAYMGVMADAEVPGELFEIVEAFA